MTCDEMQVKKHCMSDLVVILPSLCMYSPLRCPVFPAETRAGGSFISASFQQVLLYIKN